MTMRGRGHQRTRVRPIEPADDGTTYEVIRAIRREFAVMGEGFDAQEPQSMELSRIYGQPRTTYFVVEVEGSLCGGGGIAPYLGSEQSICELQRMYLAPEARGRGLGKLLLQACLDAAQRFNYRQCYLETTATLHRANHLYERAGFRRLSAPLRCSKHPACNTFFLIDLPQTNEGWERA